MYTFDNQQTPTPCKVALKLWRFFNTCKIIQGSCTDLRQQILAKNGINIILPMFASFTLAILKATDYLDAFPYTSLFYSVVILVPFSRDPILRILENCKLVMTDIKTMSVQSKRTEPLTIRSFQCCILFSKNIRKFK